MTCRDSRKWKSRFKANETTISQSSTKINKITTSDAINNIKNKIINTWQNNWSNVPLLNKLRNIKSFVQKWKIPLDITRRVEVVTARVRIGHTHLTHAYLISKEPKPSCETFSQSINPSYNDRLPKILRNTRDPQRSFNNPPSPQRRQHQSHMYLYS